MSLSSSLFPQVSSSISARGQIEVRKVCTTAVKVLQLTCDKLVAMLEISKPCKANSSLASIWAVVASIPKFSTYEVTASSYASCRSVEQNTQKQAHDRPVRDASHSVAFARFKTIARDLGENVTVETHRARWIFVKLETVRLQTRALGASPSSFALHHSAVSSPAF